MFSRHCIFRDYVLIIVREEADGESLQVAFDSSGPRLFPQGLQPLLCPLCLSPAVRDSGQNLWPERLSGVPRSDLQSPRKERERMLRRLGVVLLPEPQEGDRPAQQMPAAALPRPGSQLSTEQAAAEGGGAQAPGLSAGPPVPCSSRPHAGGQRAIRRPPHS